MPPLPVPLPSYHLLPVFLLRPSLSRSPGACLSGSVPVCLFADDSTRSRCDAQQLLVCFAALPSDDSHALIYLNTVCTPPSFFCATQPQIGEFNFIFRCLFVFLWLAPSIQSTFELPQCSCWCLKGWVNFLFFFALTISQGICLYSTWMPAVALWLCDANVSPWWWFPKAWSEDHCSHVNLVKWKKYWILGQWQRCWRAEREIRNSLRNLPVARIGQFFCMNDLEWRLDY